MRMRFFRFTSLLKPNNIGIRSTYRLGSNFYQDYKKRDAAYRRLHTTSPDSRLYADFKKPYTVYSNDSKKLTNNHDTSSYFHINAANSGVPILMQKDGSYSELNALSKESWPEFVETLDGKISISLGYRIAMGFSNAIPITHAILYVTDEKGNHALFGCNRNPVSRTPHHVVLNDLSQHVSRKLFFYKQLTIQGRKEETVVLFKKIEEYLFMSHYSLFKNNCFTPLILALKNAETIGFQVPENYYEHLLITVPKEHNLGAGIAMNDGLRKSSNQVSDAYLKKEKGMFKS